MLITSSHYHHLFCKPKIREERPSGHYLLLWGTALIQGQKSTLPELSGCPHSFQSRPVEKNPQFCQRCHCSMQVWAGLATAEVPVAYKAEQNNPDFPTAIKIIAYIWEEFNTSTPNPRNASLFILILGFPLVFFTSGYYFSIKTFSDFQTDEELTVRCAYQD